MNLPNKISLARIFLIPVVMFFYLATFFPAGKIIATIIYVIAASTDFVDGMIARRTNQVTNLGKFLDESADKLLTTSILLMLLASNIMDTVFGVVSVFSILARDQIVGFIRRLAVKKNIVIAADKLGKIKTIILDISLALLMIIAINDDMKIFANIKPFEIFTFVVFGIGLIMNIVSGVNYVVK